MLSSIGEGEMKSRTVGGVSRLHTTSCRPPKSLKLYLCPSTTASHVQSAVVKLGKRSAAVAARAVAARAVLRMFVGVVNWVYLRGRRTVGAEGPVADVGSTEEGETRCGG